MKTTLCIAMLAASFGAAFTARGESCPQGSSRAIADGVKTLSDEEIAGHLLNHARPKYPGVAKAAHVRGVVMTNAVIRADGTISSLVPVCGEKVLIEAALKAVKRWTYPPFELDGKAVQVDTTIRVDFALNAKKNKPYSQGAGTKNDVRG